MAGIQVVGNAGVVAEVENASRALRTVSSAKDVGSLGAYAWGGASGVMAAGLAANAEIFQFRWTHATNLMVPRSVTISAGGIVAFAAGICTFQMVPARSWSVDGTGGTAVTWATNDNKKRTNFGTTLAPSNAGVRIASTAALTAGTKTLDANSGTSISVSVPATAGTVILSPYPIWQRNTSDEYPYVFTQNEGFILRATVPATGTWTFSVSIEWAELSTF